MPKLTLKFEHSVQRKHYRSSEVSIGRSPDNGLVIDNPSVSNYHARVFNEEGRLMLEDFGSLNGTFVNGQRVKMVMLKPGDSVVVGKHTIVVSESREMEGPGNGHGASRPAPPKINETVVLDTKERRDFSRRPPSAKTLRRPVKVPTLIVLKGKTDQREYMLNDKLTVVGKSGMATVKLKGWFAPKAAAQINRRDDNSYYIGGADKIPTVNGQPITRPTKLSSGDIIEVAGIQLEFVYRD